MSFCGYCSIISPACWQVNSLRKSSFTFSCTVVIEEIGSHNKTQHSFCNIIKQVLLINRDSLLYYLFEWIITQYTLVQILSPFSVFSSTTVTVTMTEFWLISAPGEKTCQQTWDKMMAATTRTNNLSTNHKFNIPDLKVRLPHFSCVFVPHMLTYTDMTLR